MTHTNEQIATETKPAAKRPRKMAREPKAEEAQQALGIPSIRIALAAKRPSKADLVLGLLQRPEGATIDQLVAATSWLPHTTRAALTGLMKKRHALASEMLEGQGRVYRVTVV